MNKFPITSEGLSKLELEIKELEQQVPNITAAIATAREQGDLSENAEYHAAREELSRVQGKLTDLKDKFSRAEVIDGSSGNPSIVTFGANVLLLDQDTEEQRRFKIVGSYEIDAAKGLISHTSPLGSALLGKSIGDEVEVSIGDRMMYYKLLSVSYN